MNRDHQKKAFRALALFWLGLAAVSTAGADAALTGEKWVDALKFNGDMRIRHESFFNKTAGQKDRDRERFRLRFGVKATIQDFDIGLRLASGSGEQVSTNQTFGALYAQKSVFIDQAYMRWKAREYVTLTGGRMPNPFWRTYASDVMWDDDVNPEGYAVQIDRTAGDRLRLFANFGYLPLNENSSIESDPWLFGHQIGARTKLTEDVKINMAASLYSALNERLASLAPGAQQEGNTRVSSSTAQLGTTFQIAQFTGELAFHAGPIPLSIQGDFIRNMEDATNRGGNGYQTGAVVGKAKNAWTWEFAYFYKYLQTNASFADLADSDFGNGGTNRKGHIAWLAVNPREYAQVKFKYFTTKTLNPYLNASGLPTLTPAFKDINRLQCDVSVKF